MNELKLHPIWKEAASEAAKIFSEGDLISVDWLHKNLGINKPVDGSYNDFRDYQLDLLKATHGFRDELLETYNIAISTVIGEGYRILKPKEQTKYAEEKCVKDVKKSIRKAVSILTHINFDALNDTERKENADAKCRIAAISSMSKNKKLIK